jgi:hypothetical protein
MTTPSWIDEARETLKNCGTSFTAMHRVTGDTVIVADRLIKPGRLWVSVIPLFDAPFDAGKAALEWLAPAAESGETA